MKIDMSDVTLMASDLVCQDMTVMAMEECLKHAAFGDVRLYTNIEGVKYGHCIKSLQGPPDLIEFVLHKMPATIETRHILMVQWDSWIIDPGMWRNDFLNYDYVGAPWWFKDGYNVGNGGFSLRSKALMELMADHRSTMPIYSPEDNQLCRHYRKYLPQFSWAPEAVATEFAFERSRPSIESRHFGFHGIFNWPFVMLPDKLAERMAMARANEYVRKSGQLLEVDRLFTGCWAKLTHVETVTETCDAVE